MRKNLTLLTLSIILLCPIYAKAQIDVSRSVEIEPKIEIIPYDSTQNFLGDNPYGYIGQELYLLGNDSQFTFRGFVIDYTKMSSYQNNYQPEGSEYYSAGSDYEKLVGKYFKVIDVVPHPSQNESSSYKHDFYLKLIESQSADILYKDYDGESRYSFEFIVVGYFEKKQSEIIGEQYILSSTYYTDQKERYSAVRTMRNDRETAQPLTFNTGEIWEVEGLTIDEDNNYRLSYLLRNERGNLIAMPEFIIDEEAGIYSLERAENIINQIGKDVFYQLLTRDVQIGWHKSLVELAVGSPRSINETTTGNQKYEQYVYGDNRYLYFENDIFTSYQGEWMFGVPYLCYECEE